MASFLHSADWQIGKPFARVRDPDKRARLRQARLEAIARIAAAVEPSTAFLLVAGDLFDSPTPGPSDISAVCAAVGELPVPVLVIPGNHDHGAPGSLWHGAFFRQECQRRSPGMRVLLEAEPLLLPQAVILPCPLLRRRESSDPCGWLRRLDWRDIPSDRPRIVLAHGPVQAFGAADLDPQGDADEENPAGAANLLRLEGEWLDQVDYVALGDWHGLRQVSDRAWYCGTPEPDRFPRSDDYRDGQVLRVVAGRGEPPRVTPLPTGSLGWHPLRFHCRGDADLARLEQQLDLLLAGRVGQDLLLLEIGGRLSLEGHGRLRVLLERLEAQLLRLKCRGHCRMTPTEAELAELTRRPDDPLLCRVASHLIDRLETLPGEEGAPEDAAVDGEVIRRALMELHRTLAEVGLDP